MNKQRLVSFIIPTLWRSDCTIELVETLLKWPHLQEIIIVDNAPKDRPIHPVWMKCKILEQSCNIYVNPAWNLGVEHAAGRFLAICNDDILFDPENLTSLIPKIRTNQIIGLHKDSFDLNPSGHTSQLYEGHSIGEGWGCLLLLFRDSYVPIPHSIKIWFGDDWLAHCIGNKKRLKIQVLGSISASAGDKVFDPIKEVDKIQFEYFIWTMKYRFLRLLSKQGIKWPLKQAMISFNRRIQKS